MFWLKGLASYSAARDGRPCGVSGDLRERVWGTDEDEDEDHDTATQEQQHAGRRNTYLEHARHGRHRAHIPPTNGPIEGIGILQRSEGRAAVWSERRSRSVGMGDGR